MKTKEELKNIAKNLIINEKNAIENLLNFVDDTFAEIIELIAKSSGRVIVTGIGKSANIGAKIVSTLNSTGTPAAFMHAADAIHGDLGMIQADDVVICISKSGNTPEIKVLVPLIKNTRNTLIALVGNIDSYLANHADYVINSTVSREACPNNLAPTSSTTAQLVMGDAIAVALLEYRGFTAEDFAKFHPGGALGKRLYMKVSDLYIQNAAPMVSLNTPIQETIIEMTVKRLGCTAVIEDERLQGIITDGDLRRMLQKGEPLDKLHAKDVMTHNPQTIHPNELAVEAFFLMKEKNITQLVVLDDENKYVGIVHLHDILKEGII